MTTILTILCLTASVLALLWFVREAAKMDKEIEED